MLCRFIFAELIWTISTGMGCVRGQSVLWWSLKLRSARSFSLRTRWVHIHENTKTVNLIWSSLNFCLNLIHLFLCRSAAPSFSLTWPFPPLSHCQQRPHPERVSAAVQNEPTGEKPQWVIWFVSKFPRPSLCVVLSVFLPSPFPPSSLSVCQMWTLLIFFYVHKQPGNEGSVGFFVNILFFLMQQSQGGLDGVLQDYALIWRRWGQ